MTLTVNTKTNFNVNICIIHCDDLPKIKQSQLVQHTQLKL